MIDLDPYTDIEVDPHTGAIVLAPGTEASAFASATGQGTLRKFYFQPEDRWLKAPIATAAAATTTTTATHAPSGGLSGSDEAADGQEGEAAQQEEHPRSTAAGGDRGGGGGGGDEWWSAKQEGERGEALREWLSGLHRERFKVVRDERDAYMNLQVRAMELVLSAVSTGMVLVLAQHRRPQWHGFDFFWVSGVYLLSGCCLRAYSVAC